MATVGYGRPGIAAIAVWAGPFVRNKLRKKRRPERPGLIGRNREGYMFIVLFAILLLAWLGGFLVFHVSSALIHILLLFAVISLVVHFFSRKTVA
jgi:polyferredoxin